MNLAEAIAGSSKDKDAIKRQIGTRDSKLSFFKPLPYEDLNVKQRYVIVKTRDTSSDSIWGRDNWNTAYWDNTYTNSKVIQRIVQSENVYREWFYDDVFKDASTTATWDTTNHKVDFTSGQIAQSTSVCYNNGTIVSVTVSATYSGTLTFQMSADGGTHWETVTLDSSHTFSNTGNDLRWKVTESGSSTATLNSMIININIG